MASRTNRCPVILTVGVVLVGLMGLAAVGGCAPSSPAGVAAPTQRAQPSSSPARSSSSDQSPTVPPVKLMVIIEENRSAPDVSVNMPFLTAQGRRYGAATNYFALRHPSLPNYLALAGGSLFGVRNDEDPSFHKLSGASVFSTLSAAGRSVKTYAEGMPSNCYRRNAERYAVRHNPWTYFADPAERDLCGRLDVAMGDPSNGLLADDIAAGTLPDFSLAVPDVCDDGHDCSAGVTDAWLKRWLPVVESGPDFRAGRLAAVVTWDEDDDQHGNQIPLFVLHPAISGRTVATRLDHFDLSATISAQGPVAPLRNARGGTDVLALFGIR